MNGMAVTRSAAFARIAGTVLVAIGAVGALAWLWLAVRAQQALTGRDMGLLLPDGAGPEPPDPSVAERLDTLAAGTGLLLTASLAAAVGIVARMAADYAVTRTGGSLTGYEAGDVLPDDSEDSPAD
jgi:hypothetical protein